MVALGIAVLAHRGGLLPQPAHVIDHILFLDLLDRRLLAMLDERIDARAVAADREWMLAPAIPRFAGNTCRRLP